MYEANWFDLCLNISQFYRKLSRPSRNSWRSRDIESSEENSHIRGMQLKRNDQLSAQKNPQG